MKSSRLLFDGFEGVSLRRKVAPPDAPSVAPQDRLPPLLDDGRGASSPVCPTPNMSERRVPEVLHFRDFSPVIRKQIEDVAPPPAHPVVAAIVALQRPEARLDLDLIVHEREYRIEIATVENLIHQQGQIHVLARHPRAQYRVSHRLPPIGHRQCPPTAVTECPSMSLTLELFSDR